MVIKRLRARLPNQQLRQAASSFIQPFAGLAVVGLIVCHAGPLCVTLTSELPLSELASVDT